MNKEKLLDILTYIWVIFLFLSFAVFLSYIGLKETTTTYYNNGTCDELRECVILNFRCLDRHDNMEYLMWSWEADMKAWESEQRNYYKNNCYYDAIVLEGETDE